MKSPTLTCPTCLGTGQKKLSPLYRDTLAIFRKGNEFTSIAVTHMLDIEHSVAMMRLSRLTKWGFLKRTGSRREYLYTRSAQ